MDRLTFFRLPEEVDVEEGYVLATYYIETPLSLRKAAEALSAEQSTGTWLKVLAETGGLRETHGAKIMNVYEMPGGEGNVNKGIVSLAFPVVNFGSRIPNLLSTVAGNLFEIVDFISVRLIDLRFSKDFIQQFKGPKFGIKGTREVVGVSDRPLVGCIMKPDVGLKPDQMASLFYQAAKGGLDLLKDDELYGAMGPKEYSPLDERVTKVMEALDKANSEKNEKTLYAVNITDEVGRLLENADLVQRHGANCIMINFLTVGLSALRMLAEDPSVKVPLHCHRDMFAALTRPPQHGVSTTVLTKICRMAGGDQIHVGSVRGKMYEHEELVAQTVQTCVYPMKHIQPALPVASGKNHAGTIAITVQKLGMDVLIAAGGGVFGHPMGPEAGAKSLRQALEAYLKGTPIEEQSKKDKELKVAIDTWGHIPA